MFDYNDAFGPGAAGSPIKGTDWPVKALFNLDNTCRLPYGFEQAGGYPGMCKIGTPVAEKTDKNCQEYCYVFGERIVCYKVCK